MRDALNESGPMSVVGVRRSWQRPDALPAHRAKRFLLTGRESNTSHQQAPLETLSTPLLLRCPTSYSILFRLLQRMMANNAPTDNRAVTTGCRGIVAVGSHHCHHLVLLRSCCNRYDHGTMRETIKKSKSWPIIRTVPYSVNQ